MKSSKARRLAWYSLSFAVIVFLLLAGFPPAAIGQDHEISPPSVVSPIHRGTKIVAYTRGTAGYGVWIYAGTEKVGEGRVNPLGSGWVVVDRELQEGETITAVQVDPKTGNNGVSSVSSPEVVRRVPTKYLIGERLKPPTIVGPLFACLGGFWVKELANGVKIPYDITGPKSLSGYILTPYEDGFIIPPSELEKDQTIEASQDLPYLQESEHAIEPVKPKSDSLTSLNKPQIVKDVDNDGVNDVTVGSQVLQISNLITGTKVDIYEGPVQVRKKRIGGGIASGTLVNFPVSSLTTTDLWAEQSLCEVVSPPSDTLRPKSAIAPPEVKQPICEGAPNVTVLKTELGADVELQVQGKGVGDFQDKGGATAPGGTTIINVAGLAAGDQIRVQQSKGTLHARTPPSKVVKQSDPVFSIESGQDQGPVFVSDALTNEYGPVFMVTMCGAERLKVEIQGPSGFLPKTINLMEVNGMKGYFDGRLNWTDIKAQASANIPTGEYKATFTADGQKHEKYFYVTAQGCAEMEALCAHNKIRQQVNRENPNVHLQPLRWSETLAANAQKWAEQSAITGPDPASGKFPHSKPSGENIAAGSQGGYSVTQMIDMWDSEKDNFIVGEPFGNGASTTGSLNNVAHYTQVVWELTTEVGCAVASGKGWDILVCHYNPEGNVLGKPVFKSFGSAP